MSDPVRVLHGRRVTLRPTAAADGPALTAILGEPTVARWWPSFDRERVHQELIGDSAGERHYAIEVDGRVVGLIQSFEEEDADFQHASIDLFLASAIHRQGIGLDAIRTLARYLIDVRGHHRLTIDPAATNSAAIAVYGRVGFHPVGVMRQYQRMADGEWVDALLMEMLADELVP